MMMIKLYKICISVILDVFETIRDGEGGGGGGEKESCQPDRVIFGWVVVVEKEMENNNTCLLPARSGVILETIEKLTCTCCTFLFEHSDASLCTTHSKTPHALLLQNTIYSTDHVQDTKC